MTKRIVLFVEGEGESDAVPALGAKLLTDHNGWDIAFIDSNTYRVGQVNKLIKDDYREWKRKIRAALKRHDVGGVVLLLDGDIPMVEQRPFCAAEMARKLARVATEVGAGETFSVAVVFALCEYESWLIAGVNSLAGKPFPDGRPGVAAGTTKPEADLEKAPRDAKGWISKTIPGGYKQSRDQVHLTKMVDWQEVRAQEMRSFKRMESAVVEILTGIRENQHVSTPN